MVKSVLWTLFVIACITDVVADEYLRDPTTPIKNTAVVSDFMSNDNGSLRLQAVFVGNGKSRAIIDGKTCYLGEECGGYTLTSVNNKDVVLTSLDRTEKLTLPLYSFGNEK